MIFKNIYRVSKHLHQVILLVATLIFFASHPFQMQLTFLNLAVTTLYSITYLYCAQQKQSDFSLKLEELGAEWKSAYLIGFFIKVLIFSSFFSEVLSGFFGYYHFLTQASIALIMVLSELGRSNEASEEPITEPSQPSMMNAVLTLVAIACQVYAAILMFNVYATPSIFALLCLHLALLLCYEVGLVMMQAGMLSVEVVRGLAFFYTISEVNRFFNKELLQSPGGALMAFFLGASELIDRMVVMGINAHPLAGLSTTPAPVKVPK